MKSNILVSVILVSYNHEKYLIQRIKSILNQTYQEFELIILDDNSTDNSFDIFSSIKNDSKVSYIERNKTNSGSPFKQWVKGMSLAKGDFIWIAESDDFCSNDFLAKIMAVYEANSTIDIVFTGTTNVDHTSREISKLSRIERKNINLFSKDFEMTGSEFLKFFLPDYCIIRNASSVVFKRSIIPSNFFELDKYRVIGDFYFWVSLCLKHYNFYYLSERLNFMRSHPENVRSNKDLNALKKKEMGKIHSLILRTKFYNYDIVKTILKYKLKNAFLD